MNRIRPARNSSGNDSFDIQITRGRICAADAYRTIRQSRAHGIQIGFGGSQHGFYAKPLARSNHAHGNLAAIGDQDAPQSHSEPTLMRISTASLSVNWAFSKQISTISPLVCA